MPEMDGWEFRREQLKDAKLRDIPVVVMTGASVYAGIDANIIVHKPLDVDSLRQPGGALLLLDSIGT